MKIEPTRNDLVEKISNILSGKEQRIDVAEWAVNIFDDDSFKINDLVVVNYIQLLGAVDLPSTDREYLYTDDDLKGWITEIKNH
ncbi:hypothetical protein ID850_18735 [Xenorhabdus sp. Flor]|uniref:hypothetical protein n=1 Tax=Xenorhabdus cabanillasii TaxID=351673 RepID=UPI0019A94CC8|nr:hypothetical protein [Xenorhabdus sp. Flor]MBD2816713.1 hypothetical protein [Xenorhabdus sp. Flor]